MTGVTDMASGLMDSVIDWIIDPANIVKVLTGALLLLSPAGLFKTAIKLVIAGVVALFGWSGIKAAWDSWNPTDGMGKSIKDSVNKAASWISETFSWTAIKKWIGGKLPDNKLGDLARRALGIAKPGEEDTTLADAADKNVDEAQNPEPKKKKEEKETQTAENTKKKTEETAKSTSDSQTELAMLNTSMKQLIELTKTNTTAVKALNGNLIRS